jgi:thiol-disulfide isomerase/thioredoxin
VTHVLSTGRLRLGIAVFSCLCVLAPGSATTAAGAEGIEWAPSFEFALEQARTEKKIVMVDFFTHWCHWCKVLDEKTYSDLTVIEASRKMVNVKVNAGTYVDIAKKYGVNAYPTVMFLKPDGTVRMSIRGFKPPERFLPQMENAMSVGGQLFAIKNQVLDRPTEPGLREQYIQLLTLDGQWSAAASEADTLLQIAGGESSGDIASWKLDALIYRLRAGEDVRKPMESWARENRGHERELEARYHLGVAQEAAGESGDAQKQYEAVSEGGGKSWIGAAAETRLHKMREPGPKGT